MDLLVARTQLQRPYVTHLVQRNRDDQVLVHVAAGLWKHERLWRLHDQVRLTQLPPLRPGRRRREVGRVALGCAPFKPSPDQVDLAVSQAALAFEPDSPVVSQPRRHQLFSRKLCNLLGAFRGVSISQKIKWAGAAGVMTSAAQFANMIGATSRLYVTAASCPAPLCPCSTPDSTAPTGVPPAECEFRSRATTANASATLAAIRIRITTNRRAIITRNLTDRPL